MQIPLQVTFRGMSSTEALDTLIREKADKLDRFFDRITSCRVLVEAPHRRHHKGNLFNVRIDMTVPGQELVVNRTPAEHHEHEDCYTAIREAFEAAERRLEDFVRRQRSTG